MLTVADVRAAHRLVAAHLWPTPLLPSDSLGQRSGGNIYLKLECWQRTGSFKLRGALNKLASLLPQEWARGVVTASAGNHGLGVATACQALSLPSVVIFVPESAPMAKVKRLAALECQVRRAGADYDACHAVAEAYARDSGAIYVSAYDDPAVIAGQGTVALEILRDLQDIDLLLVPVGGGGLIAGMAVAVKSTQPALRVVGIQPAASPAAFLSLRDGHPYETYPASSTICDGLAGGFGRVPFGIAQHLVDEVLVVPEADIRRAVGWLLAEEQLVVEGSGAIAIAPLLNGQLNIAGQRAVAVLTGRNMDAVLLREILIELAGEEQAQP